MNCWAGMKVHLGLNTVLFYHYHYLPRTGFDEANKVGSFNKFGTNKVYV